MEVTEEVAKDWVRDPAKAGASLAPEQVAAITAALMACLDGEIVEDAPGQQVHLGTGIPAALVPHFGSGIRWQIIGRQNALARWQMFSNRRRNR